MEEKPISELTQAIKSSPPQLQEKKKGILKNTKKEKKKGLRWDESNLQENEKIKSSFQFTKINEPKTPYYSYLEDEAIDKMVIDKPSPLKKEKKSEWDSSSSDSDSETSFEEKRKAHYGNEFIKAKLFAKLQKDEE